MDDKIFVAIIAAASALLGSFIPTMMSYLNNKEQRNFEIKKNHSIDQKNMVKDLALKLEKVESMLNKQYFHLHNEEIKFAKEALIPASEEINSALAISNILGNDKLVASIGVMSSKIDVMYNELLNPKPNQVVLNNLQLEFDKQKRLAYPYIRELYNNA
jgi:hypothetical protein